MLLDERGEVLRAAKLWNDTTGAPNLARLVERIGARRWVMRIGTLPTAAFTIAKLAWVAEHEPGLLDRVATMLLPHDYLTYWLTGEKVTDRSEASGTGYFDATDGQWIPSYLSWRQGPGLVHQAADRPRACRPGGHRAAAQAAQLGIGDGVLVGAGGGDQHAAYLGLGLTDGDQYFSIGTSGVVATSSRAPVFDTSGAVDGVADMTGGYLPLMSTLNARQSRRPGRRTARHGPGGDLGAGAGRGTDAGPRYWCRSSTGNAPPTAPTPAARSSTSPRRPPVRSSPAPSSRGRCSR